MADREPFPYEDDWVKDIPELMAAGVMQSVAKAIVQLHPSESDRIFEILHCRAVWSAWDFHEDGEPFLNIQYKYPSVVHGENEIGSFALDEEPLRVDDAESLGKIAELASNRTVEIWRPFSGGDFVPAKPLQ